MNAIVIGASGAIASAIIQHYLELSEKHCVIAVSRKKFKESSIPQEFQQRIEWLHCDYTESAIQALTADLADRSIEFTDVFITNGILHAENINPEKRVQALQRASLFSVMEVNACIPLLWVKYLQPLLKRGTGCIVTILSARIGSIADNELGGWYSYRMSKAALNMGIKTASIEFARIAPNTTFLLYHPGTTDSSLSKPFQKNVPEGKLFSPRFTAERLFSVIAQLPNSTNLFFKDWQGNSVEW
ncbi:SDR family NAD(P)-dependent oxidoreductase [Aurantivibrio plasticivorans]